jgi:putative ABC transport system permease protein
MKSSWLERVLQAVLLRLYPADFRNAFQDQWRAFLEEQRREGRYGHGLAGGVRYWMDVIKDVVVSAVRVRLEMRPPPGQQRGAGGGVVVESIVQDLRFAFRTLRRRPLYAGVAVLTLGLGVGAATAMFSVVDGVLLTHSIYRDPERLVAIWQRIEGREGEGYTAAGEIRLKYDEYKDLRAQSTAFQDVAVYTGDWGESTLGGGSRPQLVYVGATTASLLPVLGITPALGRWFLPEEVGEGAGDRARVTVMTEEIWRRQFAADRGVLGSSVIIDGISYTVIGVLPRGFRLQWLSASLSGADDPHPRDFWVPVGSPEWGESPGSTMWEAIGRLARGATLEQARVETSRILAAAWPSQHPAALLHPRMEEEVRGLDSPILLLFGATALLLLIACGNVAALSLGEMQGRTQEVATRVAIGAGRIRVGRQFITESVVLGLLGSVLGALLAVAGTRFLVTMAPPIPRIDEVRMNFTVLVFAGALGTLSGILFGLAPALFTARAEVGPMLRAGGRTGSKRQTGLGRWVLSGEIALTVMLLVASGLLGRSLARLLAVDPGFDPRNLATVEVGLPETRYGWDVEGAAWKFMGDVLREMESIPGVEAVSATNALPFPDSPSEWATWLHPGDSTYLMPELYTVAPGYLDFMGIPITEGRGILSTDDSHTGAVAVVNQSLARALWGDRSPVGQEMYYPAGKVTVVGVAGDTREASLQRDPPLTFYVPFAQLSRTQVTFAARTRRPPEDVLPAMRQALWRVDGDLAVTAAGTLERSIAESVGEERYRTLLMTTFALLASALAAVGIGGLTARQVAQQTRELGIRKALGAADGELVRRVLRSVSVMGATGVGLGLVGSYALRHLLAAFLFGIGSFDPLTYGGIGGLFLVIALVCGYLPARRILKVDPVMVLRAE